MRVHSQQPLAALAVNAGRLIGNVYRPSSHSSVAASRTTVMRAAPTTRTPSSIRVWTVAGPMPRLAPVTTAVLAVRLRFMTLNYGTAVAWSLAVGCLELGGCSSGVGHPGSRVSWPGARCDRAFSGVDGVPGRLAVLDADAAEGHVGEVDAEADGVGLGELVDEVA